MVRRGVVVSYGGSWECRSEPRRIKAEGERKIDTIPASRGGATAHLSMGWGRRVRDKHVHRTHGAKAGLVLHGVATVGVRIAVTSTASVTMGRI